jgi:hypothetical protein
LVQHCENKNPSQIAVIAIKSVGRVSLKLGQGAVTLYVIFESPHFVKIANAWWPYNFQRRFFDKAFCLSPKGDPDLFVISKQPWFRQVKKKQSKLAGFIGA